MRAHYLQHVPFEGLGSIEPWLVAQKASISSTTFFESPVLPSVDDFDFLIIMGGPMSANDDGTVSWITAEKQFIRAAINAGKVVLGVCLGAQLIAASLGAKVYKNHVREIGWFPIEATEGTDAPVFNFPSLIEVFHWHGETFDLPEGAIHLCQSQGCRNQAFQVGSSVIGLQFHLETTPDSMHAIVGNCKAELVESRFVQSESQMRSVPIAQYHAINNLMGEILSYLTKKIT